MAQHCSMDVLQKLRRQFDAIPDNVFFDEVVKMMPADLEGRCKILDDLSRLDQTHRLNSELPFRRSFDKPTLDVVKLDEDSEIYQQVSSLFQKTLRSEEDGENCEIENIFHINNKSISDTFVNASKEMERRLKRKPREEILLHGTSGRAAASIMRNNFDADASPSDLGVDGTERPKRWQYGQGIYLTAFSSTSLVFGNTTLVCKVLLGNCEPISYDSVMLEDIPAEYDSRKLTYKGENEARVCVIKKAEHILPYCVITLKNKELSAERKRHAFISSEKKQLATIIGRLGLERECF